MDNYESKNNVKQSIFVNMLFILILEILNYLTGKVCLFPKISKNTYRLLLKKKNSI